MDLTTELCVTFVSMVNCCEVLSVCMNLFWGGACAGAWGSSGQGGGGGGVCGIAFVVSEVLLTMEKRQKSQC